MKSKAKFLVGLGASAGGLEALEKFFDHAPVDSGGAFVVVMHLSRDFKSMLDELLVRHTNMPVRAAKNGELIEPDTVYVIQPATILEADGASLIVSNRPIIEPTGPATTVDTLFRSIAKEWGDRGGGVVLSGSGSDGADGVVAINDAGGFACVQSPETAKFDTMPVSALGTNAVRAVEAPEMLAETVVEGILLPRLAPAMPFVSDHDAALATILNSVVGVSSLDAGKYKHSTFERRVQRRMMDLKIESLTTYAKLVADDAAEANKLGETLLIGVTEFFRDDAPFKVIAQQVVPELIRRAQVDGRPIRIWVPGCATGEEAYSLAMLFESALDDMPDKIKFQIFATDVKREHLAEAGRGEYDEDRMQNVPAIMRERFFTRTTGTDRYVVDSDLRKTIVFAPHDVLVDPPFTRLDMISCRNMLIYFSVEAQQTIISGFAFGLVEKGFLFMGSSETVGAQRESFEFIDARNRILRRTAAPRSRTTYPSEMGSAPRSVALPGLSRQTQRVRQSSLQPAYAALLKAYAPPSLLVSVNRDLLHSFGSVRDYLRPPEGVAHMDAADMVDKALKTPMIAGIERAVKEKKAITFSRITLESFPTAGLVVDLTIEPLMVDGADPDNVIVLINDTKYQSQSSRDAATVISADALSEERISELGIELERTREALQSTIEEIETTNEELQATNEELMSSNEELQSTNEELSSVNEELYSVNSEYQRQNDELSRLSSDFDLLLQSTEIGVVFLDIAFNITRFTSLASDLFGLTDADIGRPMSTFRSPFSDVDATLVLENAVESDTVVEYETIDSAGVAWLLRAVVNANRHGAVLTVINIGRLREAEKEARKTNAMLESLRSITHAIYLEFDPSTDKITRELGWFDYIGLRKRKPPFKAGWKQMSPKSAALLSAELSNEASNDFDIIVEIKHGATKSARSVRLVARRDDTDVGERAVGPWSITGVDVHEIATREREARDREAVLEGVLRASPSMVSYIDNDERYRYVNDMYEEAWQTPSKDILGRTVEAFMPPAAYVAAKPHIRAALKGKRRDFMLENDLGKGRLQRLSVVYEPVRDSDGVVSGFAVDTLDVTRFYERAEQIDNIDRILAASARLSAYAVLLVDRETGIVEFANTRARERLGLNTEGELPAGVKLSRLTPDWGDRAWTAWLKKLKPSEDNIRQDILAFNHEQKPVMVDLYAGLVGDHMRPKVSIRIFENEERAEVIQDLKERSRQLAISNRDLEQFASVAAHDMRAPLRHMTQFVGFLEEELGKTASSEALEYLSIIGGSATTMSDMVEGLLDYARLGRTERQFTRVELATCVKHAQSLLSKEIEEAGASMKIGPLPSLLGDKNLLTRLFQNLLGNAVKYTAAGQPPVIKIDAVETQTSIKIRVADKGIGIKPELADRIFDLFHRLHGDSDYTGIGLGLATCRRICEIHDGDIGLDNRYKSGSCFIVTLPKTVS